LQFEWDDAKNEANRIKHDIAFEEAALIFRGIILTEPDERKDYGETRDISIGTVAEQVVIVVVHTDRNGVTRLISARTANRTEKRRYYDYCKKITQ
jgi:uncharacterized DUF497 family protein